MSFYYRHLIKFVILGIVLMGLSACDVSKILEQVDDSDNENVTEVEDDEDEEEVAVVDGDFTIGLSYDDVMVDMEDYFIMEEGVFDDGTPYYEGQTESGLAFLSIEGDKDNIMNATLAAPSITDNEEESELNSTIMAVFLDNTMTDEATLDEVVDFVVAAIYEYADAGVIYKEKVWGNKKLVIYGGEDRIPFLTVEHRDFIAE